MRRVWLALLISIGSSLAATADTPPLGKLKQDATAGDAQAQYRLGRVYEREFDLISAADWYWTAAAQGLADAQYRLGKILIRDFPLKVDGKRTNPQRDATVAAKWFWRAAHQGHAEAQFALGRCFAEGDGVVQDDVEAYKWFGLAAKHEHERAATAQTQLIFRMTADQIALGQSRIDGFLQDADAEMPARLAAGPAPESPAEPAPQALAPAPPEPAEPAAQPARQPEAQPAGPAAQPAPAPEVAPAVEPPPPPAPKAQPPKPATLAPVAESEAAEQYRRGLAREASGNLAGAAELYWAAGKEGLADAQYRLGQLLMRPSAAGTAGTDSSLPKRDPVVAAKWLTKAANQGHPMAQLALGHCYVEGSGIERDYTEAFKWFSLAARQGDADAASMRDTLALQMSSKQIDAGLGRADRFKPVKTKVQQEAEAGPR